MHIIISWFTECMKRVEEICGKTIPVYKVNLLDKEELRNVFKKVSSDFTFKLKLVVFAPCRMCETK